MLSEYATEFYGNWKVINHLQLLNQTYCHLTTKAFRGKLSRIKRFYLSIIKKIPTIKHIVPIKCICTRYLCIVSTIF